MSEEAEIAARYRRHAAALRAIAESDGHLSTRETLVRIAEDYDMMADTLERVAQWDFAYRRRRA